MSTKRTPAENAERRLRSWIKGEHSESDVAADVCVLLAELEDLRAIAQPARAAVKAYRGDSIYSIESKGSEFMDALCALDDAVEPF